MGLLQLLRNQNRNPKQRKNQLTSKKKKMKIRLFLPKLICKTDFGWYKLVCVCIFMDCCVDILLHTCLKKKTFISLSVSLFVFSVNISKYVKIFLCDDNHLLSIKSKLLIVTVPRKIT